MKKAQASMVMMAVLAMVALAAVTMFFKGGITSSVVADIEDKDEFALPEGVDVECVDSDYGFNLFDEGSAALVIDGEIVIEMKDRCLFDESDIAETVCDGYKAKEIESRCPVLEFPEGMVQTKCIDTMEGSRCESCEDYGLVDCDGRCC